MDTTRRITRLEDETLPASLFAPATEWDAWAPMRYRQPRVEIATDTTPAPTQPIYTYHVVTAYGLDTIQDTDGSVAHVAALDLVAAYRGAGIGAIAVAD